MDVLERLTVLRSKNAGPFVITLGIVFAEQSDFGTVRQSLAVDEIAAAFRIDREDLLSLSFLPALRAAKFPSRAAVPAATRGGSRLLRHEPGGTARGPSAPSAEPSRMLSWTP